MINPRLRAAVEYLQTRKHKKKHQKSVLVVPFAISVEDALALRNHPCCASMILRNPEPKVTAQSHFSWLGCYADDGVSWQLPGTLGIFVFLGPPTMLTKKMLHQVASTGARSIVCEKNQLHFVEIPLIRFHFWHFAEQIIEKFSNMPASSLTHHLVRVAKKLPGTRALWHRVFRRDLFGHNMPLWDAAQSPVSTADLDIVFFRALLKQALLVASASKFKATPKRFISINSGLAAGGAERQIVNTLRGLKSKGFDDICLIGEYLHRSSGLDFYLPHLESAGIAAYPLTNDIKIAEHGFRSVPASVGELLAKLPSTMAEEILNLVEEFKSRRPAVVHAWQDSTSIKVGIAAVIVGVPCIVLASRNVTPVNFGYYQEYMRSAYQALTELNHIVFLNNSVAGALDYCRWLELPQDRFQVVRNGVDFSGLARIDDSAVSAYRTLLGIPEGIPVVGSIFRFWAEKRPMLWLHAAQEIAKLLPDVHFLLVGDGPMRKEMESFVRHARLQNKVHMPGARTDIATPLSSMTVFVLTSEFEGTPNVVLEAQWLGLPVIATDAGGTREAIKDGVTGWCCSKPDAVEIAIKCKEVLLDSPRLKQLRELGPSFIDQQFSLTNMIDHTLNLYMTEG